MRLKPSEVTSILSEVVRMSDRVEVQFAKLSPLLRELFGEKDELYKQCGSLIRVVKFPTYAVNKR